VLQAYIFAMLTATFLGEAVEYERKEQATNKQQYGG